MFKKIALSILFTTNTIHKVTAFFAAKKHGESCTDWTDWCESPFVCHTVSWNGRYRRGEKGKTLKQRRCTMEREARQSEGKDCISDHECDYERRHEDKDEMYNPKLVCEVPIDEYTASSKPCMDIQGTCTRPPPLPEVPPSREETQYRGWHGKACREEPTEEEPLCESGLECMHQHKVTLDGCYYPASTVQDGKRCFEDVECMGGSQCQKFLVPKWVKMASGGIKRRPDKKKALGYSTQLCAPKGSPTVWTLITYPARWVKNPNKKREFVPEHSFNFEATAEPSKKVNAPFR